LRRMKSSDRIGIVQRGPSGLSYDLIYFGFH